MLNASYPKQAHFQLSERHFFPSKKKTFVIIPDCVIKVSNSCYVLTYRCLSSRLPTYFKTRLVSNKYNNM